MLQLAVLVIAIFGGCYLYFNMGVSLITTIIIAWLFIGISLILCSTPKIRIPFLIIFTFIGALVVEAVVFEILNITLLKNIDKSGTIFKAAPYILYVICLPLVWVTIKKNADEDHEYRYNLHKKEAKKLKKEEKRQKKLMKAEKKNQQRKNMTMAEIDSNVKNQESVSSGYDNL